MKEWEAKNREARNAYKRERLAENPELKEANQARVVAWVKENREARKEHQRRYREKNREKIGQANRPIRNENGEITAKEKKHQERNRTQRALDLDALLPGGLGPKSARSAAMPPTRESRCTSTIAISAGISVAGSVAGAISPWGMLVTISDGSAS